MKQIVHSCLGFETKLLIWNYSFHIQVLLWINQNFLLPEDITSDGNILDVRFLSYRSVLPLFIQMKAQGQVITIKIFSFFGKHHHLRGFIHSKLCGCHCIHVMSCGAVCLERSPRSLDWHFTIFGFFQKTAQNILIQSGIPSLTVLILRAYDSIYSYFNMFSLTYGVSPAVYYYYYYYPSCIIIYCTYVEIFVGHNQDRRYGTCRRHYPTAVRLPQHRRADVDCRIPHGNGEIERCSGTGK